MRRKRTKQTFKPRLLAFVLALALVWYSFNPAPRPVMRKKQEAEPPDGKKRNIEPRSMPVTLSVAFGTKGMAAEPLSSPNRDEDDFEWPEFIDG